MFEREFIKKAEEKGVPKGTIFKDWLLSYVLKGVVESEIFPGLIFKGGTCLKKCYFQDYRFSEDLDFTINRPIEELNFYDIHNILQEIRATIDEPPIHLKKLTEIFSKGQKVGYDVDLRYWGSMSKQPKDNPDKWNDKIELQLRFHEHVIFQHKKRPILHDYKDYEKLETVKINTYSIEEILCEKLRSLLQRPRHVAPRDCYDIWYLSNNTAPNWEHIIAGFYKKVEYKGISFNNYLDFISKKDEQMINRLWRQSLENQVNEPEMPDSEEIISYLKELLKNNFG